MLSNDTCGPWLEGLSASLENQMSHRPRTTLSESKCEPFYQYTMSRHERHVPFVPNLQGHPGRKSNCTKLGSEPALALAAHPVEGVQVSRCHSPTLLVKKQKNRCASS